MWVGAVGTLWSKSLGHGGFDQGHHFLLAAWPQPVCHSGPGRRDVASTLQVLWNLHPSSCLIPGTLAPVLCT